MLLNLTANLFHLLFIYLVAFHCPSEASTAPNQIQCGCKLIAKQAGPSSGELMLQDLSDQINVEIGDDLSKINAIKRCERDCREKASRLLEYPKLESTNGQVLNLDESATAPNTLCTLYAQQIRSPGASVYLHVASENGFSQNVKLGNLCCNLPCKCEIRGQTKQNANALSSTSQVLVDLSNQLTDKKNKGYRCQNELHLCEKECKIQAGKYLLNLNEPETRLNGVEDIYATNSNVGDHVCRELKLRKIADQVNRPGMETFIRLQTSSERSTSSKLTEVNLPKNIYLGKVCCKSSCECDLVRVNSTEFYKNELVKLIDLTSYIPASSQKNDYYDCSDETLSCMRSCRLALGRYFENEAFAEYEKNVSTSTLDLFGKFENGITLCGMIGKIALDPGQNIYLRYKTHNSNSNLNIKYLTEDLHVGRMCCKEFFDTFSPNNKCKAT